MTWQNLNPYLRRLAVTAASVAVLLIAAAWSQESPRSAALSGSVRDSSGNPLPGVSLHLSGVEKPWSLEATTNANGEFRFASVPPGRATLNADLKDFQPRISDPINFAPNQTQNVVITLVKIPDAKGSPQPPEFYDEPQFTVAGVAPPNNSGAHGSDTVFRTTDSLARATAALGKSPGSATASPADEQKLREAIAGNPNEASAHHALADVEERLGKPLDAVREYQRAAELDPSEHNLFDWGTDLLAHRALQPAEEVFSKGRRLYPKSPRMWIGLGVSAYARGDGDKAAQFFLQAYDLDASDPTAALFLGRVVAASAAPPAGSVEGLARFARAHPENARAHYSYALALWKQNAAALNRDPALTAQIESHLQTALRLDPAFGPAYLQLGIVSAKSKDFPSAISAYQKAIEVSLPDDELLAEAHYRLAQAYLRMGDKEQAHTELELHSKEKKKIRDTAEKEKAQIQEFVISLRAAGSAEPPQP